MPTATENPIVARLCSFAGRIAGSDAERRAANDLASTLRADGRRVAVEATYVHPQAPVVHALHCLIGVGGSLAAIEVPAAGFAAVLIAATALYLDLNGRLYLLRSVFFRRSSQNVVARPARSHRNRRVVLCANYDAPRTGAIHGLPARALAGGGRLLGVPLSPSRLMFWSLALLLPPLGLRMAGIEDGAVAVAQLPQTLILIGVAFGLVQDALSEASPGANDNASGVAAAIEAVRRLDAEPPRELEVLVLLTGGGTVGSEGMRSFLRSHRKDLDRSATWFIGFDAVGAGDPVFLLAEGPALGTPADHRLVAISEALSEGERARPMRSAEGSEVHTARLRRYPALTIGCREPDRPLPANARSMSDLPAAVDPGAIGEAASLAVALVGVLDRELSREAESATGRD